MSQPFRVSPEVFDPLVDASTQHAEEFDRIVSRLAEAHVARGSFGYMPASDDLHQAYTEHVDACVDGLTGTADTMRDVAEGSRVTQQNYEGAETDAVASFQIEG